MGPAPLPFLFGRLPWRRFSIPVPRSGKRRGVFSRWIDGLWTLGVWTLGFIPRLIPGPCPPLIRGRKSPFLRKAWVAALRAVLAREPSLAGVGDHAPGIDAAVAVAREDAVLLELAKQRAKLHLRAAGKAGKGGLLQPLAGDRDIADRLMRGGNAQHAHPQPLRRERAEPEVRIGLPVRPEEFRPDRAAHGVGSAAGHWRLARGKREGSQRLRIKVPRPTKWGEVARRSRDGQGSALRRPPLRPLRGHLSPRLWRGRGTLILSPRRDSAPLWPAGHLPSRGGWQLHRLALLGSP